jgi:hypothetical protein
MTKHMRFSFVAAASMLLAGFEVDDADAGVVYQVSVDTSALSGQDGNLDFQFDPGGQGAESATATVTGFQMSGGSVSPPALLTGDASGALPGTLTLDNSTIYNDAFQGITYGTGFTFLLTLSGQAVDNPGGTFGSSFALSLYDEAGITPLLTTAANGSVLTVNLDTQGLASAVTFPQSLTDQTPVVTVANGVPEPSSLSLATIALSIILITIRSRLLYEAARQTSRQSTTP